MVKWSNVCAVGAGSMLTNAAMLGFHKDYGTALALLVIAAVLILLTFSLDK